MQALLQESSFEFFKNNSNGRKALNWWHKQCMKWCSSKIEDGKFGDQKYLDDWRERFPDVCVSINKGIGLAPWNIGRYSITFWNGKLYVDEDLLLFYHFQKFFPKSLPDRFEGRYDFCFG